MKKKRHTMKQSSDMIAGRYTPRPKGGPITTPPTPPQAVGVHRKSYSSTPADAVAQSKRFWVDGVAQIGGKPVRRVSPTSPEVRNRAFIDFLNCGTIAQLIKIDLAAFTGEELMDYATRPLEVQEGGYRSAIAVEVRGLFLAFSYAWAAGTGAMGYDDRVRDWRPRREDKIEMNITVAKPISAADKKIMRKVTIAAVRGMKRHFKKKQNRRFLTG